MGFAKQWTNFLSTEGEQKRWQESSRSSWVNVARIELFTEEERAKEVNHFQGCEESLSWDEILFSPTRKIE